MKQSKDKRDQFLFTAAEQTTDPVLGIYIYIYKGRIHGIEINLVFVER